MKITESINLWYRAYKYRYKYDKGGIEYIITSIKKEDTVFDIGAHKAGYLFFLRKQVGKQGKVYAFEPQTDLYNYINKNKALFKWDNVVIEHLALSDNAATATLYIPSEQGGKGSSPGATIVEQKESSGYGMTETVNTETLDSYCSRYNIKPSFLKIDVEGNELRIFKGGIETLKKYKPRILVEIEARHVGQDKVLETFSFMKSMGYSGHFIYGSEQIPLSFFSFEKHQNLDNKEDYCNNFIFEHVLPAST